MIKKISILLCLTMHAYSVSESKGDDAERPLPLSIFPPVFPSPRYIPSDEEHLILSAIEEKSRASQIDKFFINTTLRDAAGKGHQLIIKNIFTHSVEIQPDRWMVGAALESAVNYRCLPIIQYLLSDSIPKNIRPEKERVRVIFKVLVHIKFFQSFSGRFNTPDRDQIIQLLAEYIVDLTNTGEDHGVVVPTSALVSQSSTAIGKAIEGDSTKIEPPAKPPRSRLFRWFGK